MSRNPTERSTDKGMACLSFVVSLEECRRGVVLVSGVKMRKFTDLFCLMEDWEWVQDIWFTNKDDQKSEILWL